MEYLQGRALTNAIGNLKIQDAYADALRKLGLELEEITEQVICQLHLLHVKDLNVRAFVHETTAMSRLI